MEDQKTIAVRLTKKTKHDLLFLLIGIVIAVLIKLCVPMSGGLTAKGASFLAVFATTVFLWVSCDTAWPSVLAMVALGVFNIIDSTDIFATVYGNYACAVVIAATTLSAKLEETGAAQYIAKWFLSLKAIKGRPFVFLLCIILATYVISVLVSAMLAVLVLSPIIRASMDKLEIKKEEKLYKACFLCVLWLSITAEFMVPFGKVITVLLMGLITSNGCPIDVVKYLSVSVPVNIGCIIFALITLAITSNPRNDKFSNYDVDAIRRELVENPLSRKGKFAIWMTLLCFVLLLAPALPFLGKIATYFGTYETVLAYYVPIIIMCILPIDGEPLINIPRDARNIPWTVVLFLGVVMLFTTYTGNADFGIISWMTAMISPLVDVFSPIALLIVACLISAVLTNFMSNIVTMTISITVFGPVFVALYTSGALHVHPSVAIMMLGLSSSMSFLMPSATPTAPMIYGSHLTVKQAALSNIIFIALAVLSVLVVGLLFGNYAFV